MNKIYNTQEDFATKIKSILQLICPNIRKTQLKIIPYILIGMFLSESLVAHDISKQLKGDFSLVQHSSVVKRIRRFFKNKLFSPYTFYDKIIRYVISNYKKKHSDKRVHIVFDHMFSKNNYTVFMITMRIGKQGIPLWFRCFEGNNCNEAFEEELLKSGIDYVSELFGPNYDLIFLADRWFNSLSLMKHIDSLGHVFNLRLKKNLKVLVFDKKERHTIWKTVGDLPSYQFHSNLYKDVQLTDHLYKVNIAISKRDGVSEPWIIVTNGDAKQAIKDYGYRFGAIESVFKNQKSNGFYLENTVNASLKYFESMYCIACVGVLLLTIAGASFTKNTKIYKNIKIETHKTFGNKKIRIMSLFNTGLTLFNIAFNSKRYVNFPIRFILYDI